MDPLVVGALAVITVGVPVGYWLFTRSQRALGDPQLQLTGGPYGFGDIVTCRLSATVRSAVRVEEVLLSLECHEVVRWWETAEGTDADGKATTQRVTREHSETVWSRESRLPLGRELAAGETLDANAELELPAEGAPTFAAEHCEIRWFVTFRMSVPRWPDVTGSSAIVVEPRRGRLAGAGG